MPIASDWLAWQLADSAFPSGGFAHSNGVEALWKQGELPDVDALIRLLSESLHQLACIDLPIIATVLREPDSFDSADTHADTINLNAVSNRASRLQGRALLAAAERAFDTPVLIETAARLSKEQATRHLAPIFGMIAGSLGMEREQALALYLFVALRSMLSAGVRLGIVGPLESQSILQRLSGQAQQLAAAAIDQTLDDTYQPAPLLDLLQANHDRLYSRLFQS